MTSPSTGMPGARPTLARRAAALLLSAWRWQAVFEPLPGPRGIIIVYPHTSNWDFIVGVLYKTAIGLPVRWMGKASLFRWPVRRLFLALGGIPVNRAEPSGFVAALLDEFARNPWLWLAVTPEGTRSRTEHWKSGFYRIAVAGQLPVGLGFIDYGTRTIGVERYLVLSGEESEDFARIRAYYAGKQGRHPANAGPIRLRL